MSGALRDEFAALEGLEHPESAPLTAVSPNAASRWDDLRLAAQLLTSGSAGSMADTLLAYARARRLTLEEATTALEAWDAAKHPRGGFRQNPTRAKDWPSHRGYQRWHRQLDKEIAEWIRNNQDATVEAFEEFLRWRYSQPDLRARFPHGI